MEGCNEIIKDNEDEPISIVRRIEIDNYNGFIDTCVIARKREKFW